MAFESGNMVWRKIREADGDIQGDTVPPTSSRLDVRTVQVGSIGTRPRRPRFMEVIDGGSTPEAYSVDPGSCRVQGGRPVALRPPVLPVIQIRFGEDIFDIGSVQVGAADQHAPHFLGGRSRPPLFLPFGTVGPIHRV